MIKEIHTRPTQCDRIVQYMKDFGEIDAFTALRDLGVMRLASRISELRQSGFDIKRRTIKGKNRYGENVSWAAYSLAEVE